MICVVQANFCGEVMNVMLLRILNFQENNYPHAIARQFPRIFCKILAYWNRPEIDEYFAELMVNSRKERNGFPANVASDIVYMSMMHARQSAHPGMYPASIVPGRQGKPVSSLSGEYSVGALFRAAEAGDIATISRFIAAGFDVDIYDERQWTPLMICAANGYDQMASELLGAGAYVGHVDMAGYMPLHWAAFNGQIRMVALLLDNGADVNAYSVHGWTALLQAVTRGHSEIVQLLLDRGADVNAASDDGSTPLHKAAASGRLREVLVLLQKGALARVKNREGAMPIDLAAKVKHQSVIMALTGCP